LTLKLASEQTRKHHQSQPGEVAAVAEYTLVELTREARVIDRRAVSGVLGGRDIAYDENKPSHVVLRASAPWVKGLGWLYFIGNWHYFAHPPGDHADWVRAIAPTSAGRMEVWLEQLDPGGEYLVAIDVGCSIGGPKPAFKIGASDAAGQLVDAQPPAQVLLIVITPAEPMSLVTVEPQDLDSWTFHSVEVDRIG
jgi:hypothetical protein